MQNSVARAGRNDRLKPSSLSGSKRWLPVVVASLAVAPALNGFCADPSDPVLNLLLEKGMITENEAAKVQAQVDSYRTNAMSELPPEKWKIRKGIENIELFGDLRTRYEDRSESDPAGGKMRDCLSQF